MAADIASCVPETVRVYKQMVNEGLETTLAAGLAMERSVMTHVNKRVSGEAIAARRAAWSAAGQVTAIRVGLASPVTRSAL